MPEIQKVVGQYFAEEFPGSIPVKAICIVEYMAADGEQRLVWFADSDGPKWTHMGMALTASDDMRRQLQTHEEDGDAP